MRQTGPWLPLALAAYHRDAALAGIKQRAGASWRVGGTCGLRRSRPGYCDDTDAWALSLAHNSSLATAGHSPDGRDDHPGCEQCDGGLPVPGEAPRPAEPRQGAFDDPALGQNNKARQVRPPNDCDRQPINVRERCPELLPGTAAVGEQPSDGGMRIAGSLDQSGRPSQF